MRVKQAEGAGRRDRWNLIFTRQMPGIVRVSDGTDFQCSAEPSHVTTSMSEKLMNEEVDEVTR